MACRNFIFTGSCRYGSKCRFNHVITHSAEDPVPSRATCKAFLSADGCKRGSKCYRYHPVVAKAADSSSGQALTSSKATNTSAPSSKSTTNIAPAASKTEGVTDVGSSNNESDSTMHAQPTISGSAQAARHSPSLTSVSTDTSNKNHIVEASPIDSANDNTQPAISEDELTTLIAASINPSANPQPELAVQSTDPDLSHHPSDLSLKETALSNEQTSEMEPSTDNKTTMDTLSRVVIDWSAAAIAFNLELSGPGIYDRQIRYSAILCRWPQEFNIPKTAMINTLMSLASSFGEIVCPPFYRPTFPGQSLQITFRHYHEAAVASAALNGQYIRADPYMSVETLVTVTHQITVTYMVPIYIINSLGGHGQGRLHMLFGQNGCSLQWGDHHFYAPSGEKFTEVTIMGVYEEQVIQCKAVLEDLLRGRVLTHDEYDNRPLWHDFFETEEGTVWLKEVTEGAFDLKVRATRTEDLRVLIVYGSSEWSRKVFGGIVERKIAELLQKDVRAAMITATVARELRLIGWKGGVYRNTLVGTP
ncbi:hypothetical protein NHQ30_010304 [Ciborinia camelliae]|nr:hypothetical protein NHQ30_010304 [Ciborinia camelliae]